MKRKPHGFGYCDLCGAAEMPLWRKKDDTLLGCEHCLDEDERDPHGNFYLFVRGAWRAARRVVVAFTKSSRR